MKFGHSYLLGAQYPKIIAANHPAGWAAQFFLAEDGDGRVPARLLLQANLTDCVAFHLIYKRDHSFSHADLPLIKQRAQSLVPMVTNHPNVEFRISFGCEHNIIGPDIHQFVNAAMGPFTGHTNVVAVNSPETPAGGLNDPNIVDEFHCGGTPHGHGRYQFSYDGCSAVDADNPSDINAFNQAEVFFFWIPQYNGKKKVTDTTPEPQRNAWPIPQLIKAVSFLNTSKGVTKLPQAAIWKSVDEQSNVPPVGRELKPVFIGPDNVPNVQIKAINGTLLATSDAPLPFSGGGYRYYFNDFGYHYANLAQTISLNPLVNIFVGGKVYGTVNPGFRENAYRS